MTKVEVKSVVLEITSLASSVRILGCNGQLFKPGDKIRVAEGPAKVILAQHYPMVQKVPGSESTQSLHSGHWELVSGKSESAAPNKESMPDVKSDKSMAGKSKAKKKA